MSPAYSQHWQCSNSKCPDQSKILHFQTYQPSNSRNVQRILVRWCNKNNQNMKLNATCQSLPCLSLLKYPIQSCHHHSLCNHKTWNSCLDIRHCTEDVAGKRVREFQKRLKLICMNSSNHILTSCTWNIPGCKISVEVSLVRKEPREVLNGINTPIFHGKAIRQSSLRVVEVRPCVKVLVNSSAEFITGGKALDWIWIWALVTEGRGKYWSNKRITLCGATGASEHIFTISIVVRKWKMVIAPITQVLSKIGCSIEPVQINWKQSSSKVRISYTFLEGQKVVERCAYILSMNLRLFGSQYAGADDCKAVALENMYPMSTTFETWSPHHAGVLYAEADSNIN